jgi:hypothetical protein
MLEVRHDDIRVSYVMPGAEEIGARPVVSPYNPAVHA